MIYYETYELLNSSFFFLQTFSRPGCKMVDLWDVNDGGQSKRLGKRPLCPILYGGNCHPFKRVFANNRYVVLRLDYSTYVELKPSSPILMQS